VPVRVLIVCLVIGISTVAVAQGRAGEPLATQAAQAHYEAGSVYYERGDYARAAVEFEAARRDDDRPALDYNLGVCFEKLGDPARAIVAFRRFLERVPDSPQRVEIEARVAALETRTAFLELRSRVPGTRLSIDGAPYAPGRPMRVNAGAHQLLAERDGDLPRSRQVSLDAGAHLAIDLAPTPRSRRRALAIGLGVTAGIAVVGVALTVGLIYGRRGFEPHETDLGSIVVGRDR
jgi:tetratricopeptide (TPR) repeat protein